MWITLLFIFLGAVFGAFTYKAAFNVERLNYGNEQEPSSVTQFV